MNDFKKEFDDIMGDFVELSDSVTYVCFVMDHSGSMGTNQEQSMSNFNEYLKTVQNEAKDMQTVVTVIEFDDKIKTSVDNVLAELVNESNEYWIGNTTALYDAIGQGITTIRRLMDNDPREDKAAIFFINTDGWENASKEFTQEQLQKVIKDLEDTEKWTFTFLAEGIDAAVVGKLSDFAAGNTMSFDKSPVGYKMSLNSTKQGISAYYSARQVGETQVKNFHNDANDPGDGSGAMKSPRPPRLKDGLVRLRGLTESEENEAKFRDLANAGPDETEV